MPVNRSQPGNNAGPASKTSSGGKNPPEPNRATIKIPAAKAPAAKAPAAKAAAAAKAAGATAPAGKGSATGSGTSRPTGSSSTRPTTGGSGRPSGAGRPSGRAAAARSARNAAVKSGGNRPRSKSLAVKRRKPWGLIITCVLVIVFAAAVIGYAVSRPKKPSANDAAYVRDEIAAAKAIPGVLFKKEPNHTHVAAPVKYNTSPPTGGNHSQVWADCSGTVYPNQIANENAVHPLEHGAVWITYRPGLAASSVAALAKLVTGQNYTFMTPYAGLKTPISLQAWNYQLFVNSASDKRIPEFIKALRNNPGTTPEYPGNCTNAAFKKNPSTPGHAIWQ